MDTEATPETAAAEPAPAKPSRKRLWGMRGLVALGAILLTVGALAVWINRVVLDTNTWTDTSGKVLADPVVQQTISTYLVNQLYNNVDVAAELRDALPPRAKPLAAPAAAALRDVFARGAQRVLASSQAQTAWRAANRRAQSQLTKLLDGGGGALTTTNGAVVLNLHPILERVAGRVGGGGALPADAGTIVLLRSDQLKLAQDGTHALKTVAIILVPLVLLIFVLAIWVAPDRRRAVRDVAIAILISGLVLIFVRRVLGDQLIDRLVSDVTIRPAIHHAWWISTEQLRLATVSIVFVGLVGLIGAWFAGPGARATALRGSLAGFLRDDRSWIAFAAVVLLLLVWAPTPAARNWVTVVCLTLLAVVGFEAIRRQTAREFPEAVHGKIALPKGLSRDRGTAAAPAAPEDARLERLGRLAELHTQGVLSDEEFGREKARILETTGAAAS